MQTPLDTDFEGMSTNRAAYCASLERLQFRGRCAFAREVLERHQCLGAHARVVVVEQFAQVRHGDLDSGCRGPRRPRCQAARLRTKEIPSRVPATRAGMPSGWSGSTRASAAAAHTRTKLSE